MITNRSKAPIVLRRYRGKELRGEIHWGDALAFLRQLDAESAHLIFLDPPFNLGKAYDPTKLKADRRPAAEYWRWMELILGECVRVLREGGALYLYHLPLWAVGPEACWEPCSEKSSATIRLRFRHARCGSSAVFIFRPGCRTLLARRCMVSRTLIAAARSTQISFPDKLCHRRARSMERKPDSALSPAKPT